MADRSVAVKLSANVQGFVTGMRTAQKATEDFVGRGLDKVAAKSQAINDLSRTAGLMGAGLVAAAAVAIKTFADFDEAMSSVQAATHESAESMDLLRDAAVEAGARTAFSATEAAAGIEELAKAGVSTTDILRGGLDGALDLAAAGNISVAEAAETAASAMTQFGLSGESVTHIADLLAAGAGKAQGGVSDMSAALNQAGLVASQMGLSIEETVGSLTAFASAGLVGSDAGTSFRSMLLRLANPTKESAQLMDELGLRFYDSQGQFIGMEAVAGQLQERLSGLTQEQRNAAMAQIFGQDAIRASSILYEQGAEGVREWTSAVNDSGYAAETAAIRLDNLKGDWEEFTGALETAMIGAGEGANGPLRLLLQSATDLVRGFSDLPSVVQQGTVAIAGAGGLALLGVAGLGKILTSVSDVREAMKTLGLSARTATIAVGGIGAALGVATAGLAIYASAQADAKARVDALRSSLDETTGALTEQTEQLIAARLTETPDWWTFDFSGSAVDGARALGIELDTLTQAALGNVDAMEEVRSVVGDYSGQLGNVADLAAAAGMSIGEYNNATSAVRREVQGANKDLSEAIEVQEAVNSATRGGATAQSEMGAATASATVSVEDQVAATSDLIENLSTLYGIVLSQRDAERALEASVDSLSESIAENGTTMDITTAKGRANQAALDDVAKSSWSLIDAMKNNGATASELQRKMETLRGRFVSAAQAAGYNADEANALADQLGLIPSNVNTHVTTTGTSAAISAAATLRQVIDGIPRNVNVAFNGHVSGSLYSASSMASSLARTPGLATGGPVYGPGTGTSDSVVARLSAGEHVLTAAEVQAAGGHAAIFKLRKSLMGGFVSPPQPGRFANGGPVHVAAPSLDGARLTGTFEVADNGLLRLVDGRIRQSQRAEDLAGPRGGF